MLKVNRSTYYKHFSAEPSPRIKENQYIASLILHIYADYNKRLGAYKITYVLQRDYGINISVGRVYRLMKQLLQMIAAILLMPKLAAIICSRNLIRKLPILCGLATLLILKPEEYGTICALLWIYSHER